MMKDGMMVREAAKIWGISERRITKLCKEERIPGAVKEGRNWILPSDAEKPADERIRTGKYRKRQSEGGKLPLPVGISDYRLASSAYYYVDKTLMIRDFLDEKPMVTLFTRPRRFGKSMNMDMFRTFFEKTTEDTSVYFRDKQIWKCGEKYRMQQGRYPVIYLTFKDARLNTWAETYAYIEEILRQEFSRHTEVLETDRCHEYEQDYFRKVLEGRADSTDLMMALSYLSRMLDEQYQTAPVIMIDEYDVPIHQGYQRGFYDEAVLFMRNLFSGGLKDNRHLSFGLLTGVMRVAKESIFSGLNNLKVNSVLDQKYSQYFGFTPEEVKDMAAYYGVSDNYAEICDWYNGYRFGQTEIFNPWSVISYFSNDCQPKAYWQATGSNEVIGEILTDAGKDIYEDLNSLLQGKTLMTYIDTEVIYPEIRNSQYAVYSFLLVTGYLKIFNADLSFNGEYMCKVALPNREISLVYKKEILQKLTHMMPPSSVFSIQEALYSKNVEELQSRLHELLLKSVSSFDTAGENFYHGFVLGLCAVMDGSYRISSNRESGEGRYDLALIPMDQKLPGILIELKTERNCSGEKLKKLSQTALEQIFQRKYDADMYAQGVKDILKYGVAFSGKNVEISVA